MATTLADLVVRISADSAQLRRELEKSERAVGGFSRKASSQFANFGASIKAAVGALAAIGVATQLKAAATAAVSLGDSLTNTSNRIGVTAEALQRLRAAAQPAGVEAGSLDSALLKLSKNLGEAQIGAGTLVKALAGTHDELLASVSGARDANEAYLRLADGISKIESPTEQARIAVAAFGRAGLEQLPVLKQGRDAIEAIGDRAQRTGGILSNQAVKALDDFGDALSEISRVALSQFAEGLAKSITGTTSLTDVLTDEQKIAQIGDMAEALGDLAGNIAKVASQAAYAYSKYAEFSELITSPQRRLVGAVFGNQFAGALFPPNFRNAQGGASTQIPGSARSSSVPFAPPKSRQSAADKALREQERNLSRLMDLELQYTREALQASGDRRAVLEVEHDERIRQLDELQSKGLDVANARLAAETVYANEVHKLDQDRLDALDALRVSLQPELDTSTSGGRLSAIQRQLDADLKSIEDYKEGWEETEAEIAELREAAHMKADEAIREESAKTWEAIGEFAQTTLADAIAGAILDGEASFDQLRDAFVRTLIRMGADAAASGLFDLGKSLLGNAGTKSSGGAAGNAASGIIGAILGLFTPHADGGVAMSPHLGLIGEAGPEAIIPLSQLRNMVGGGAPTINVINKGTPIDVESVSQRRTDAGYAIDVTVRDSVRRNNSRGELRSVLGQRHQPGVG